VVVIEINDNPNLDAGVEDAVLGPRLYDKVMNVFLERMEATAAIRNELIFPLLQARRAKAPDPVTLQGSSIRPWCRCLPRTSV